MSALLEQAIVMTVLFQEGTQYRYKGLRKRTVWDKKENENELISIYCQFAELLTQNLKQNAKIRAIKHVLLESTIWSVGMTDRAN